MNKYLAVLFVATIFSAGSQVLLKLSAREKHKSWIYDYLNWKVIMAYGIFALVLVSTTYAYTNVDMRFGPVIDTFTYVFVMILSFFILKERFTRGQLIGNLIIIAGVLIYTL